ncbi:MAG: uroporphyrinogen-III synthase [Deferribacterota bacterium]|nr:uroporphyrinogen-III synthase [Deferribacterota bacterium]
MNVLVTRTPEQSVNFINLLSKNGFYPFLLPLIRIEKLDYKLDDINYDYIVFTSKNACKYFLDSISKFNLNLCNVIAVGSKTAEALEKAGINVNYIPEEYSQSGLIRLFDELGVSNKKILIPGSSKRDTELIDYLCKKNCLVKTLDIYETKSVKYPDSYVENFIKDNNINIITLFSPSAAKSLISQVDINLLHSIKIVSIGIKTANFLNKYNLETFYPNTFTEECVLDVIVKLRVGG